MGSSQRRSLRKAKYSSQPLMGRGDGAGKQRRLSLPRGSDRIVYQNRLLYASRCFTRKEPTRAGLWKRMRGCRDNICLLAKPLFMSDPLAALRQSERQQQGHIPQARELKQCLGISLPNGQLRHGAPRPKWYSYGWKRTVSAPP